MKRETETGGGIKSENKNNDLTGQISTKKNPTNSLKWMALCVTFNQFEQRNIQRYFIDDAAAAADDNSNGALYTVNGMKMAVN